MYYYMAEANCELRAKSNAGAGNKSQDIKLGIVYCSY